MTLFDRYILLEILAVLTFGTLSIVGIFFGTIEFQHVLQMMSQSGIPANTVMTVLMLQLPTGMAYCLPAGAVVSVMLVLGRHSRDSEITALQLLGVSRPRVLAPFLAMGVLTSAFCFMLSEQLAPEARDVARRLFTVAANRNERPFANRSELRDQSGDKPARIFELGKEDGNGVHGFVAFDLTHQGTIKLVWADSARFKDHCWKLSNGQLFDLFTDEPARTQVQFQTMLLSSGFKPQDLFSEKYKTTLDKTTRELAADIQLCNDAHAAPPPYLLFQYWRRFSHPLSCLFLVLAATPPMMHRRRRQDARFALLYGALLVLGFFIMQEVCLALVANGRLDGFIGAWLPITTLAMVGLLMNACLKFELQNHL